MREKDFDKNNSSNIDRALKYIRKLCEDVKKNGTTVHKGESEIQVAPPKTAQEFLEIMSKMLPITFPEVFLDIYWYNKQRPVLED